MAYTALHNAIMALPHSGRRGFEGLVADMLSEVTGLNFTTQKSGAQKGTDALASTFTIGLEGKQYKESTSLGVDALKAKIVEAATTHSGLELWILAATRAIDPLDEKALRELAAGYGMEAFVLAWDVGSARIPRLALLCAMARNAVTIHLGSGPGVAADLAAVRGDPGFGAQSQLLVEELRAADVGYSATRAALVEWNKAQMADVRTARLQFDSEANVLAGGNHRIGRPKINQSIEHWWSSSESVGVLLGEEGMGKTWAALGWWVDRANNPETPLCVIIPARDVDTQDGPALVAKALLKATRIRDLVFWEKRLERWVAKGGQATSLLVIIDGLNQKWSQTRWSEVALSLTVGHWDGRARLLLTCRPDHWEGKLRKLADLAPPPTPMSVGRFDDKELADLLQSYRIDKTWDPAIKDLIRVPRLCHVAVRRHDDLAATGDITLERLIYEDWRHRSASAQATWSESEFHDFIVGLANTLRASVNDGTQTRAALMARITQSSGEETTDAPSVLSEILDGGWMEPTGKPHELRVRKERVPPVLGLALLSELRSAEQQDEADMIIAAALESYQGNDISVAILRFAATFSLMDTAASDPVRIALIKRWLGSQNFSGRDFLALWPLVGANPGVILDCVEQLWFGPNPSGHEDEVIVKSFANAVKWPIVAAALETRLTDWLSRYWLDPLVGAVIGRIEDDDKAEGRRRATAARAESWQAAGGQTISGIAPRLVDDASWGRARATELLSWLPRASFLEPIKAWAITSALLGSPTPHHRMEWVLRWNENDPAEAEAAVSLAARELFGHGHEVSCDAAALLLRALASPTALQLLARHVSDMPPSPRRLFDTAEVYGGNIAWDYQTAKAWPRAKEHPLDAALGLIPFAVEPALRLGEAEVAELRALALRASTQQDYRLDERVARRHETELPFARWASAELGTLVQQQFKFPAQLGGAANGPIAPNPASIAPPSLFSRLWTRFIRTDAASVEEEEVPIPGSFEPNSQAIKLAPNLAGAAILLSESDLALWRHFARKQRLAYLENREPIPALHAVSLVGLAPGEQVAALLEWPLGPPAALKLAQVLEPLTLGQFEAIASCLAPSAPEEQIINWLSLLAGIELRAMPKGWSVIAALFGHGDKRVRALAMQVAYNADDRELADQHEASDWACPAVVKPREAGEEGAYGSLLLAQCGRVTDAPSIAARVHAEVLGKLADDNPGEPAYLEAFTAYVEAELDLCLNTKSQSYPRGLLNNVQGWRALATERPGRLKAALAPLIEGKAKLPSFFMMEQFPLYDAIDALATFEPATAVRVIEHALKAQSEGGMRSGSLFEAAMRLPTPEGDSARNLLVEEANDDAKLLELVNRAVCHQRVDWLIARIEADLASATSAFVARGMVLAAFLPETLASKALWGGKLAKEPASGWLHMVHENAMRRFKRYSHAQHWYDAFAAATDPEAMFSAHRLFVAAVDSRVYASKTLRPTAEERAAWPPAKRAHWRWGWQAVKDAVKRDEDHLKKTLLFSSLPGHAQYPKLH